MVLALSTHFRTGAEAHAERFVEARNGLYLKFHGTPLKAKRIIEDYVSLSEPLAVERDPRPIQASSDAFSLLPPEIRNRIYAYAVAEPGKIFLWDTAVPPPLARVSRQCRSECLPVFLYENHFHVLFVPHGDAHEFELAPMTAVWIKEIRGSTPVMNTVSFSTEMEDFTEHANGRLSWINGNLGADRLQLFGHKTIYQHLPTYVTTLPYWDSPEFYLQYDESKRSIQFRHQTTCCRVCAGKPLATEAALTKRVSPRFRALLASMEGKISRRELCCQFTTSPFTKPTTKGGISLVDLANFAAYLSDEAVHNLVDELETLQIYELASLAVDGYHLKKAAAEARAREAESTSKESAPGETQEATSLVQTQR